MPDIFSVYWRRHVLVFLDSHFTWTQSRLVSNANSRTRVLRTTTTVLVSTVPILSGRRYLRCFSFTYCISGVEGNVGRARAGVSRWSPRHARVRLNFDSRSSTPPIVLLTKDNKKKQTKKKEKSLLLLLSFQLSTLLYHYSSYVFIIFIIIIIIILETIIGSSNCCYLL